jgi:hypothetical protein
MYTHLVYSIRLFVASEVKFEALEKRFQQQLHSPQGTLRAAFLLEELPILHS